MAERDAAARIEPSTMKRYGNLSGTSGVVAYEERPGQIVVAFRGGELYRYTDQTAGARAVAEMQRLARAGKGLSTYIARKQPGFEREG